MSKEKANKLRLLTSVDLALYKTKKNQRSYWRTFSHEEWVEFCKGMADWFKAEAPNEWDERVKENKARKEESDKAAIIKKGLDKYEEAKK